MKYLVACGLLFASGAPWAQPVYKCGPKGAIVYSHEPCLGAEVIDTTPTQGLDKWTGQSRKGNDVIRSEQNKAMADALKPLFNETPEAREKRHRRFKLPAADRQECDKLDATVEAGGRQPANKAVTGATAAEQRLFEQRKRYRELRC